MDNEHAVLLRFSVFASSRYVMTAMVGDYGHDSMCIFGGVFCFHFFFFFFLPSFAFFPYGSQMVSCSLVGKAIVGFM